jgi:GTPase SAR1 family protein
MHPLDRPWKFVVIGDESVGKTCLIHSFILGKFPEDPINSVEL